ncbi:MAG TPA: glycosyltransferase family A protein [Pyrinomonadaceae bacterium]|nr:glycosyltransferase family A protein [Pyrinomonadaceae bacterium]
MGLEARTPTASVIIPTHSRPHLLPRAVESACGAGAHVEVVVVDDGSTDETAEVCRGLEGVVCVRLEQNQGVAAARNVGILASSAPFVAFLDDDDLRLPGSLDSQVKALARDRGAGFSCGAMLVADQGGRLTGEVSAPRHESGDVFWPLLELDFPVMPISVVIRRECFSRVGLFDSGLSGIDDWDMLVRIAELYPVVVSNEPVSIYRKPTPSSGQGSSAQARHLSRAARHQLRLLGLPRAASATASRRREVRRRALERIADTLFLNAARAICDGAYGFACANTLAALRLSPRRALRPAGYVKLASMLRARAGLRDEPAA